jgi:hypothetical protein
VNVIKLILPNNIEPMTLAQDLHESGHQATKNRTSEPGPSGSPEIQTTRAPSRNRRTPISREDV